VNGRTKTSTPEEDRAYWRARYHANIDKKHAQAKSYRDKAPEKHRVRCRAWRAVQKAKREASRTAAVVAGLEKVPREWSRVPKSDRISGGGEHHVG
jgi:hypothetical protein